MNRNMHSLVWYTRADLLLIMNRNISANRCTKSDNRSEDTKQSMCTEVSEILSGMIKTLDDTLAMGNSSWNVLFLSHVIQACSVHLSGLETCRDAYQKLGLCLLGLDNSYVRVRCHITTVVCMCQALLGFLCGAGGALESRRGSTPCLPSSTPSQSINVPVLLRSSTCPTPNARFSVGISSRVFSSSSPDCSQLVAKSGVHRVAKTPSNMSLEICVTNPPETPSDNMLYKDVLSQHKRMRRKLICRNLLNVHANANTAMSAAVPKKGPLTS
jgi:hypothetical protein